MTAIGSDLVQLMAETLETELALGPEAEDVVRLGTYTRDVQLSTLKARERGELVDSCDPRSRDELLAETRRLPWPELEREARRVVAALAERITTLTHEELVAEEPWSEVGEPPLWRQLFCTGVVHQVTVMSERLRDHGEVDEAIGLNERLRARVRRTSLPPKAEGDALYNLACLHAGAGRRAEAVELLEEAIALNPHLVEWSQKDSDLDGIRDEPGYLALVAA
jgi:tetratricopeptide (TPR) repeat protein